MGLFVLSLLFFFLLGWLVGWLDDRATTKSGPAMGKFMPLVRYSWRKYSQLLLPSSLNKAVGFEEGFFCLLQGLNNPKKKKRRRGTKYLEYRS